MDMKATLKYTGIRVKDLDRSIAFYTKLLGMKQTERTEIKEADGEAAVLVSVDGGPSLELNYYNQGSRFDTPYSVGEGLDHLAFHVENLDEFLNEAKKAGSPQILEIRSGTSRWAYIEDPNGIWVEVFG